MFGVQYLLNDMSIRPIAFSDLTEFLLRVIIRFTPMRHQDMMTAALEGLIQRFNLRVNGWRIAGGLL